MLGRGQLAAILATAITAAPAFAQQPLVSPSATLNSRAANPASSNASKPLSAEDAAALAATDFMDQVDEYSEHNPLVVIGIAKGAKDNITGERIGDRLSDVLRTVHSTPSKYFVTQGADYSRVFFAVKGHIYGPYGLKESIGGLALAADNFHEKVRKGIFPRPDPALYPRIVNDPALSLNIQ